MEIPANFNFKEREDFWYKYWMDKGFFHSEPDDREPFSIVIPPPNVTGVLHMGHMLNNTIQDILVRRARMQGKNACWVPGTDHASIATEAKVVNKLREEGISKDSLTRDEFLEHAWEWTHKHGGLILEQLKKLGASCDWERTKFTMDEDLSASVIKTFIDLHKKGLIYQGKRMVNWDPSAKTALSDEEVYHEEVQSKLYYVRYAIEGSDNEYVTIATTRPETILGDTAICINPNDERFTHLKGKKVIVPLVNRVIPIIEDDYVDIEFGTGCLKITPAHDENDFEIGKRHELQIIDILNENGTLSSAAQLYVGTDRFEARKLITVDLEKSGSIVKIEDYNNKVGYSERTKVVIEPRLSKQWFCSMKKLAEPALKNVMDDTIAFHPKKFKNVYRHWMENIKDWCISRQLWWGHRIPVYYLENGEYFVAENIEGALEQAKEKTGNQALTISDLTQEEDVLDTWFSSWLWPISVFDGINNPENEDINYYYPTNDLVTGHDIIFFWIARMIVTGYEYKNELPFENVYFTGMVRDDEGRKMSKQLGNSPDPLDLIAKYGADAVRVGMLFCSPAGGDLLFKEELPEQGRNFSNKIWNAFKLVQGQTVDTTIEQPEYAEKAIEWFEAKLTSSIVEIDGLFDQYKISEALMTVYRLFWDDFSSWFLESIKPGYQKPIDAKTYEEILGLFDKMLKVLHPFMPFLTEEIWHFLKERKDGDSLMTELAPTNKEFDATLLKKFEIVKEVVSNIRNIRKDKNIPNKDSLELSILQSAETSKDRNIEDLYCMITKLGNISSITKVDEKVSNSAAFIVNDEYFVPLGDLIDVDEEIAKLQKKLDYEKGFIKSVDKKLSNERFVNNAPEKVVAIEKQKRADAAAKIKAFEDQMALLQK